MRERHFVWVQPDGVHCAFVHDKIRSALLARLSVEARRNLHWQIALSLQKSFPDRVFDLAYHFDAAGDSERALQYALLAARQARSQHSLHVAEQQYRIADRGARSADRAVQYGVAEGLGDVLMLLGRYGEAEGLFQTALKLAEGPFAECRFAAKWANSISNAATWRTLPSQSKTHCGCWGNPSPETSLPALSHSFARPRFRRRIRCCRVCSWAAAIGRLQN